MRWPSGATPREQRALALDRLGQREPVAGERMAAARLGEAPQQGRRARLQEQHAAVDAARASARARCSGSAASAALRASTLTATRSWPASREEVDDLEQQRRRQVVDAVVAARPRAPCSAMLLPEPDRPLTRTSCMQSLSRLSCIACFWRAMNSRHRVDAAQLEDVVAHRGLDQHREVAAGGHRDGHLADRDAEDLLGQLGERQALGRVARCRARAARGARSAAASSCAAPRSRRRWCGC